MSSSFSAKRGSLLILKLSTQCGFNPCVRQIRPMVESETPVSRAMMLRDQCVALSGMLCVLLRTTSATVAAEIVGLRPEHCASFSKLDMPKARKRLRQRAAIRGAISSCREICKFCRPLAADKTMRKRSTTRTAVVHRRMSFCNSAFSSELSWTAAATRILLTSNV